jgi:hypothetical protein
MKPFSRVARAAVIGSLILFSFGIFVLIPRSVRCKTWDDYHTIARHFHDSHAALLDFQLVSALTQTLQHLIPYSVAFVVLDLYILRKRPVEHVGCFAYWVISLLLYLLLISGIWFFLGGWGPPHGDRFFLVFMGVMAIPAMFSEWRIFRQRPPASDDGEEKGTGIKSDSPPVPFPFSGNSVKNIGGEQRSAGEKTPS